MTRPMFVLFGLMLFSFPLTMLAIKMSVDSFSGPPTSNEIKSFIDYINSIQPVTWLNTTNMGNEYAQGHSGEAIKAMGLMYELSNNKTILDRMIFFVDTLLSQRNDILAEPKGQRIAWTKTIAPIWPGAVTNPAPAGAEQGDSVGHLAYCARLILEKPAIWSLPIEDPMHYGTTYYERAKTYLIQADKTLSQFLFAYLLDLSKDNHLFFTQASPYKSGENLPWNQQMMITYGLQNAAAAHEILRDDPKLVNQYDAIVQANLQWFWSLVQTMEKNGTKVYDWGYSASQKGGEDSNHASLDVAGFYRAYTSGRYGITEAMMTPFSNTLVQVMTLGPHKYAGRVDGTTGTGHGSSTTYIRSGFLLLADFVPNDYTKIMSADLSEGGMTGSPDQFSRFEWIKYKRYLASR